MELRLIKFSLFFVKKYQKLFTRITKYGIIIIYGGITMNTTTNNNTQTKTITSTSELNQFILHKYQTEFNFDRQLLEKLKPYIKYTVQNSPLDIS
jgi:hypothetical protein